MLAAQESLKLCETERPAGRGVGGVKTSSGKLRLPSQSGLAPDFTQPFSNLKLFTNTKQEPSSQRKQKMSKKKKKTRAVSEDSQKVRLAAGPPPPPHSLPGEPLAGADSNAAPPQHLPSPPSPRSPRPPPVLRRPPNAPGARHRISGNQGPHFPVSAHPQPPQGQE